MRVLFLTHYFPPEVGAPQTRLSALAQALASRGHSVCVHTGFPNYPSGGIRAPYRNRPLLDELCGPVRVIRSAVLPSPNRGVIPRLANHLAFSVSALAAARATGPQDVVVAESPPLFLAGAAVAYARGKGAPLVLNVSDLWPDTAVELGSLTNPRLIAGARRLESFAYGAAAHITVPTAGIAATLERQAASRGKVTRLGPFVDVESFSARPLPQRDGPVEVLYAGTVGLAQGIDTLLQAAVKAGPRVHVKVAGSGVEAEWLRREAAHRGVGNLEMLGSVPAHQVAELYAATHAGVVLLRDRPIFDDALPTKLFEIMACARPVVLSARGESADLVRSVGAGLVVGPEDPASLAASLVDLVNRDLAELAEMGSRGRAHVERSASLQAGAQRWEGLLEDVVARARLNAK